MSATLVRDGSSWALIDAGAGDSWSQSYASRCRFFAARGVPPASLPLLVQPLLQLLQN